MTYRMQAVDAPVWEAMRALPAGRWIWLDMVGEGLHLGDALPSTPPAQLSHAWGWGPGWWARARADRDLPAGVHALVLRSDPSALGDPVQVHDLPFRTWASTDDQVSIGAAASELPKQMRQLIVRMTSPGPTGRGLWRTTVSFVGDDGQRK